MTICNTELLPQFLSLEVLLKIQDLYNEQHIFPFLLNHTIYNEKQQNYIKRGINI